MLHRISAFVVRPAIAALFLLAAALAVNTFGYLNFDPAFGFLRLKQEAVMSGWYLPAYYSHIFAGAIILLAGFFQFSARIRARYRMVHRSLGLLYVFGILFFAAPGGMIMAFFIDRGPIVLTSFVLQCSLWFYFTSIAFKKAREHAFVEHERWMYRSYALTLAAITLRLYIFSASWWADLANPTAYGIFAWLSWVPNLILAEAILAKKLHVVARTD
jgi:hypothetical protein